MSDGPLHSTSAGVYDSLNGGTYNTEQDRATADYLRQELPIAAQGARHNRIFLGWAAEQMAAQKLTAYIDLGTGYPTGGYVHEHVSPDAKILYNDIDENVVAEGQRLVADQPNIRYIQSPIENIDRILGAAEPLFGAERRVGTFMVGVLYFIDDNALHQVFQRLYDWSAPGSQLAISAFLIDPTEPVWQGFLAMYKSTGAQVYFRSVEEVIKLVGPWQLPETGLRPFHEYLEDDIGRPLVAPGLRGSGSLGFGGILTRL